MKTVTYLRLAEQELLVMNRFRIPSSEENGFGPINKSLFSVKDIDRIRPQICQELDYRMRTVNDPSVRSIIYSQSKGFRVNGMAFLCSDDWVCLLIEFQ